MDAFDIFLAITTAVAAVLGWRRGLVMQLGQLAGLIGGVVLCRIMGSTVAGWLSGGEYEAVVSVMAFVLTFIVGYAAVWLAARALSGMISMLSLGAVNSVAGAAFKVLLWLVLVSFAVNIWLSTSPDDAAAFAPTKGRPWRVWVLKLAPTLTGELHALNIERLSDVITENDQN